jgi:hypothetical protein
VPRRPGGAKERAPAEAGALSSDAGSSLASQRILSGVGYGTVNPPASRTAPFGNVIVTA